MVISHVRALCSCALLSVCYFSKFFWSPGKNIESIVYVSKWENKVYCLVFESCNKVIFVHLLEGLESFLPLEHIFFTNWCLLGSDSVLYNKQNCLSSFCSSTQDERCCWWNLKCCKSVPSEKEVMYLSMWWAVIAIIWFMRICYLLFKQCQPLFFKLLVMSLRCDGKFYCLWHFVLHKLICSVTEEEIKKDR